ncbi:MAG TPA: signal peptidase I [Candidatus Avoscillospira stercoripullorum]|uniref:Signal peptidase I n=1 Tax=Candidatus Avoscillospira stercoripullorum TaxID=2840709 RepID=A0A9D1A6R9_9FIRM|nr:signal peptidase I [Candidatus Avoscillospira stercoripullorum]
MEQDKYSVHDTIDLQEIRSLLEDEKPQEPQETPPQTPPEDAAPASAEKPEKKSEPLYECYGILHDITYILAAVTLLFVFVVRLVGVDGTSMLPTLHHGDYLILESNFLYHGDDIETGDIVVLTVPYYKEEPIVKRVVATGGQTVDIDFENHIVYVDGQALEEPYLIDYTGTGSWNNWDGEYGLSYPATVPEDCIFVLGDNRNNSTDSRFAPVGMVNVSCVLGKVRAIVLPGQTKDEMGNITDPRDWGRIGLVS